MTTIDVGSTAINRDSYGDAGTTFIDFANPANLSGLIDTIEVWANQNMSGLKVGFFYLVSGTTYKCRTVISIGSVTAGSKQTFSGLSAAIVAGDYIGFYWSGGRIEYGTAGVGRGYLAGDHVNVDEQSSFGVAMGSGSFSCYGTGYSGPPLVSSVRLTASFAGATGVGNITNKGGYTVTKRGVAYNDTGGDPDPTTDPHVEEDGDFPTGEFSEGITGLSPETLYYVRPYAYSVEEGYGFGTTMEVTTSPAGTVLATLNSRFAGEAANISYGDMRGGGGGVEIRAPDYTNPDNLCGADDTLTASPWLFRSFLYFDLQGVPSGFSAVNLVVWSYSVANEFGPLIVIEGVQGFEIPTIANWVSQNSISTKLAEKAYADIVTGAYVSIPFLTAGVEFIKTKLDDYCKFCLMTESDFENDYPVAVHDGYWYIFLPHESGKEPYLEFKYIGGGDLPQRMVKASFF